MSEEPEVKGLLPKRGPNWFPHARDWELPGDVIPCRVTKCPAYHNGHCSVPSLIKIGPNGICETGAKHMN